MNLLAQLKSLAHHFTAATLDEQVGTTLAIRTADMAEGETLSATTRAELLKQALAGEFTGPLVVEATTYVQRPTPNRNFVRFKSGTLRSGAKSFRGQVVLVDHNQHEQQARIGTILKSEAAKSDGGDVSFKQTLSIVKQHAIISVLDGTIDRFSVGWFPTGMIECSVHKGPMFGPDCCRCWPGEAVDGKVAEAVFTSWEGIEVSAVNVPAVVGTGIDQIRAALTALRAETPSGGKPQEPRKELAMNIRTILGLPDDATDELVETTLREREEQRSSLASREQQTAEQLAAARQSRIDSAIESAYGDGRLAISRDSKGARVASALETRIRSVASSDVDSAIALLDAMPKQHPNVNPSALQSHKPAPIVQNEPARDANPTLENMLPLMGLDSKDVEAYGPQNRRASAKGAPVPKHLSKVFSTRHITFSTTR